MKVKIRRLELLVSSILIFHFIFGISYSIPVIHLIALFTVIYYMVIYKKFSLSFLIDRNIFGFFASGFFIVSFCWLCFLFNNGNDYTFVYTMFLRYFMYIMTVYMWAEIFVVKYKFTMFEFNRFIFWILLIQVMCVFLSVFSINFFNFVVNLLPNNSNITDINSMLQTRYRGYSNSGGDGLSLILSLCPMISYWLFGNSYNKVSKIFYLFAFWLSFFSLLFVGRTGVVAVILFVLATYITQPKRMSYFMFLSLIFMLPFATLMSIIMYDKLGAKFNLILEYAFEFTNGHTESTDNLTRDMLFLPNSSKTFLIGDGIYQNKDSTNYMHTDSGYVRLLFFFGVTGCTLFYGTTLYFLKKFVDGIHRDKLFFLILIIVYFFVEIKRPFILGFAYTTIVYFLLFFYYLKAKNEDSFSHPFSR